jgi:hypothetical protein
MYKNQKALTPMERLAQRKRRKAPKPRAESEAEEQREVLPTDLPVEERKEEEVSVEEFVNAVQMQYKDNCQNIRESDDEKYVKIALLEAEEIWFNVQVLIISEKYKKMTDEERVSLIENDFKEFYKNFPIVSRYMICMGQYKSVAFRKMLIKYRDEEEKTAAELKGKGRPMSKMTKDEEKNKNEKIFIKRQADYVRFLWEEYNEVAFSTQDSDAIWHQAFDTLTNEFDQFRKMHEAAELKVKTDALKYKKELLFEMGDRIISGKQELDAERSKDLLVTLQNKAYRQRAKKMLKQLNEAIQPLPATVEDVGINDYLRDEYEHDLQQSVYKKTYKKMDISKMSG